MFLLAQHIDELVLSGTEVEETTETKEKEEVKDAVDTPWRLILYDDDIHTFDEVISQLMKATGCSLSEAEDKTWKVHNEGKALVHEGEFEECLRIDGVLKEIQLVTEIKG
ncbi:MAG: ATP-dependent Clp protease adaptor ClpS [Gracilimonas sp.]|uniref:ATP-dependent Clp protease adaptor ClpS n=1 Tax=Gracilimonas TaxID=649462 RepID=UPI001B1C88D7|nr:ATP-dependent Clp protease adaptor ClpS [Gracilimonas sp.]MBO6584911.1 ATP-dependent Clp protease adaptor ClpS [Gracilimonas sp.]MBO6615818.1 ATP-dependent Clp protease adaptor ClpS [Gracilimonas sp.]